MFTNIEDLNIIKKIPDRCTLAYTKNNINVPYANNIKLDLNEIYLENILKKSMEFLDKIMTNYRYLDFKDKNSLTKYEETLRTYKMVQQLIIYNVEGLSESEQMQLNALYNYVTPFFNVNVFTREDNLSTISLYGSKSLNNYTSYNKVRVK